MKIQLDFDNKTIKLENSVNLGELAETLNKILPNNQWKDFKLETNTVINNWSSPTIIYRDIWDYNHFTWYVPSTITYANSGNITAGNSYSVGNTFTASSGTYNIELN